MSSRRPRATDRWSSTFWPRSFAVAPPRTRERRWIERAVAETFRRACRDGGAGPFDAHSWYEQRSADPERDASLVLVAREASSGALPGAGHGWTSGFIKDLGIVPAAPTGIGGALVLSLAALYRDRGLDRVELKVVADNEPARSFYARLGFHEV